MTDFYPSTGSDDSYEITTTGVQQLTTSPLSIRASASDYRVAAIRVALTGINQGDTILTSSLSLYMTPASRDDIHCDIYAEDVDSPGTFTTTTDHITDRADANPTTASVEWDNTGTGAGWYTSPSLNTVIQEIIDRGGWSDDGYIVLFLDPRSYTDGAFTFFEGYEGTNDWYLSVTWSGGNTTPTIVPDTADSSTMLTTTPTVEFTGTDADSDDLRYNVQITDNPDDFAGGSELEDNYDATQTGIMHPNPTGDTAWNGEYQVDDRPGCSFTGNGGVLDSVVVEFGGDNDTDGACRILIYEHSGTFGTSSAPANAADAEDTPTPSWIAASDENIYTTANFANADQTFDFTGDDRILLEEGTYYFLSVDWLPNDTLYDNTITIKVHSTGHAGNMYLDGDSANNGVWLTNDLRFEVYESYVLLDETSGTDSGFANEDTPADTDPFNSGDQVSFTVQSADELRNEATYRWRARVKDPSGTDAWSTWTTARSFDINAGYLLTAESGTYAVTGNAADLPLEATAVLESGTLSLSGYDALLELAATLDLESGTLIITGYDTDLIYTPGAGGTAYTLICDSGTFLVTGNEIQLETIAALELGSGTFTIDGFDANLLTGSVLSCDAGSFLITGNDSGVLLGAVLTGEPGAYILTGNDADLVWSGDFAVSYTTGATVTGPGWTGDVDGPLLLIAYVLEEAGDEILEEDGDYIEEEKSRNNTQGTAVWPGSTGEVRQQ